MVPVFSFIFGIIGAGLDSILGTPYVFQCLGVLIGYIIWIRMRCSAVAKDTVVYNSRTAIYILFVTWCAVFLSGAPKVRMDRESHISENGFYFWPTVSLLISAVSIWFHQRGTYQP